MKSRVVASSMRLPFRDKDIMRHMSCDFGWNAYGTFCSQNVAFLTSRMFASTMNKKYSIVYSSLTGNTKMLADAIHGALPQDECEYFGVSDTVIPSSELLYH